MDIVHIVQFNSAIVGGIQFKSHPITKQTLICPQLVTEPILYLFTSVGTNYSPASPLSCSLCNRVVQLCYGILQKTTSTEWIWAVDIHIHDASWKLAGRNHYAVAVVIQRIETPLRTPSILSTLFLVFPLVGS